MQYREFGSLDWQVSALGFGAMRLPENDKGNIDEDRAIEIIRYAIDNGVNYIDTAWPYHGGESEEVVSKALQDGYRKQVKIATKMPSWKVNDYTDLDEYLNKQLDKLGVEKIDFYLLHTLNGKYWDRYQELNFFKWLERVREEGKIDYVGFSFHDDYSLFTEIIDAYDWDFCQIQYNYVDTEFQAGKKGLKYAADKDIPVVVMEPLRGGSLAGNMPEAIEDIFDQAQQKRTAVDWALQWLWNQPEVTLVLSGMSTLDQVKENIISADKSGIDTLIDNELEIVEKAAAKYKELSPVNCTGCDYCLPCPNGINISRIFSLYNEAHAFGCEDEKKREYQRLSESKQASNCIACGNCEDRCPQNLPIIELLEKTAIYFNK